MRPDRPRTLRRFLRYLRPQWRLYTAITLTLLVATTSSVLVPYVTGVILIDHVLVPGRLDLLPWVALLLLTVLLVKNVTDSAQTYLVEYARQGLAHRLRTDAHAHLTGLDVSYFERHAVGDLISRVVSDVDQIDSVLDTFIQDIGMNVFLVGTTLGILYALNPTLTLIIIPTLATLAITVLGFKRYIKGASRKAREAVGALAARAEETFTGATIVKAFGGETAEVRRFHGRSRGILRRNVHVAALSAVYSGFVELSVAAGMILVVWVAAPQVVAGTFTLGAFVAYLQYLNKLYSPVKKLARANFKIQKAFASADRVFALMDAEPRVKDPPDPVPLGRVHGHVRFERVSFAYHADKPPVLEDVSLEIRPGEVLALVGPSGAGKSTIAKLLLRFYDATRGTVTVDDIPVGRVRQAELRSVMAVVPQETQLFTGTVRENIAYARPGASDEEVVAAARAANADRFISVLPDGYDTHIGERGVGLSGGERQRIAIARALLKDPRVLVLDEATSNVDAHSEALIQEALGRLLRGRTTLVIAHRLSAVLSADRVAVVDGGRIVETGPPEEVLRPDGPWARGLVAGPEAEGEA